MSAKRTRTVVSLRELLWARSIIGALLYGGYSPEDVILGVHDRLSIEKLALEFRAETKAKYIDAESKA